MINTDTKTKRDMNPVDNSDSMSKTSRRTLIKTVGVIGAIGGVTGLGGITLAQSESSTIKLGGEIPGWQGQAPSSIKGETNPTLEFTVGEKVTVTWTNLDGAPHNFQVLDSNGNVLHKTKIMSEKGSSQSTSFTATKKMVKYNCVVHPSTMVGKVEVQADNNAGTEQSQSKNESGNETKGEVENQTKGERDVGGNRTEKQTKNQAENQASYNVSEEKVKGERIVGPGNKTNNSITGADAPGEWAFEEAPNGSSTNATTPVSENGNGSGGKSSNGKAKTGNGKAKTGNGNQMG